MNCSIVNARPQNISIDANGDDNNRQFAFTFYGDRTIGADYYIYDMNTNVMWGGSASTTKVWSDYASNNNKVYYYNGEEIDTHPNRDSKYNNKEFIWKTRVYEDVDLRSTRLHYPTTRVVAGTIKENPNENDIVGTFPFSKDIESRKGRMYVYIEKNVLENVTLPAYIWAKYANGTYQRRFIAAIDTSDSIYGEIKLAHYFSTYPANPDTYIITTSTSKTLPETETETPLYLAANISIDGSDTDHRTDHMKEDYGDYPKTNQPSYYLRYGDNFWGITSYDVNTGKTTLALPDSDGVYHNIGSYREFEIGTEYEIYSSFVESPYFYFTTEPTPQITDLVVEEYGEILRCKANWTAQSFVKYQWWEIFEVTNHGDILLETSEKMYIGDLEYSFRQTIVGRTYKAVLHVVSQTNWDVVATSDPVQIIGNGTNPSIALSSCSLTENNSMKISFRNTVAISSAPNKYMYGGIKILRKAEDSDIVEYLHTIEYKDGLSVNSLVTFDDYSIGSHRKYVYYISIFQPHNNTTKTTMYPAYVISEGVDEQGNPKGISVVLETYSLFALQEIRYERYDNETDKRIDYDYMYAERAFRVTDVFRPELNVTEKVSINHNLGRNTYVGYAPKPSVAAWDTNYDSFQLSFQLGNTALAGATPEEAELYNWGYTEVINNTKEYYNYLQKIISKAPPFLIKDYRGNVWFGEITTSSTEVDNTQPQDRCITIKIDFVETYPIDKIRIVGE